MLYLLRHGQTTWSESGRHTGRTDVPLTAAGEQQARAARRTLAGLGFEAGRPVLTSPRRRATDTARLAGLTVTETTEELAEWDYGDYEGVTTPQIRRTVPGWTVWTHPVPGGESAEQVAARADAVLASVRNRAAAGGLLLVGHGHFSRVLTARWLGLSAAEGVRFAMQPGAVTALGDERGTAQIHALNVRFP